MKRITILISTLVIVFMLSACGHKDDSESISVIGTWTQNNSDAESYMVLELKEDGTGSLITEPDDIGCPLDYEINGNTIMTHLGSIDDNTPMEYISDTDQILYGEIHFSR